MTPVICTFTGSEVNPLELQPTDVNPLDVAHALALVNRFAGHTTSPISVAQHCCYAAELAPPESRLRALLHDGSEAYLGDMTKWVKRDPRMEAFRQAENRAQDAVYIRFGLPPGPMGEEVKRIDRMLVQYEGKRGLGKWWKPAGSQWESIGYVELTPADEKRIDALFGGWEFWPWFLAETRFLDILKKLTDTPPISRLQHCEGGVHRFPPRSFRCYCGAEELTSR